MIHDTLITENELDAWVRAHARQAQECIVNLVGRLVECSCQDATRCRFQCGDSINQSGADGELVTAGGFKPFVPAGKSYWEVGTGQDAKGKATKDYSARTRKVPESERKAATFIFVTPSSGRRGWNQDEQLKWLEQQRAKKEWLGVEVIDGTRLIAWLRRSPAIDRWLAAQIHPQAHHFKTLESRWAELAAVGQPRLMPSLFLHNRREARSKIEEVFSGARHQLMIDTHSPAQVADVVAACWAALEPSAKAKVAGRCLIVSDRETWNEMTALRDPQILVADLDIRSDDSTAPRLLGTACDSGHAVIVGTVPGGEPHQDRVALPNPKAYHVQKDLEEAGYSQELARSLAQRSAGNLNALLRCLRGLPATPTWAQPPNGTDLAVAQLLGAWNERCEGDREIVEQLSGKAYGDWVRRIREISSQPGVPLTQRNGAWKFVERCEGWYALGRLLGDEHLNRMGGIAARVLGEQDPKFELPSDERHMAEIHGKVLNHSRLLRNGLAETLALLGSRPKALTSCTGGRPEETAADSVSEILAQADGVQWASLNDVLPLLAEAAPREFLNAVEEALKSDPCPFDEVFEQEGSGMTGWNYMTGLLWALESLAWDPGYLIRVIVILGRLAEKDPGGNWANRPANSMATILLPWLPQTCAPVPKRRVAVETLMKELPEVAWQLLLDLLPGKRQSSSGSYKPRWRVMIPDTWSSGFMPEEWFQQVSIYTDMAVRVVKRDLSKAPDLIKRYRDLTGPSRRALLEHLGSDAVLSAPEEKRLPIWNELADLVSKYRRHTEPEPNADRETIDEISRLADRLAPDSPHYRHQRLFREGDFDLYESTDDYEGQRRKLDNRRQQAVGEVYEAEGVAGVTKFTEAVDSPWRVGLAFGAVAPDAVDGQVLPSLLEPKSRDLAGFARGFVLGRFDGRGWPWVDQLDISRWTPEEKGQLFAYLPFVPEAWERVSRLGQEDESAYWRRTTASPYHADKDLEVAVDRLLTHGRPHAAVRCFQRLCDKTESFDGQLAIRVLESVRDSSDAAESLDPHAVIGIIKKLQNDPSTDPDEFWRLEWAFLPLLNGYHGASPKTLEQHLAERPAFFCSIIRSMCPSRKEESSAGENAEQQEGVAERAYRLLWAWKTPPGSRKDGTYDGDALIDWVDKVKNACEQSGHLEIALERIGQVLIHVPPDPDGLWLHRSAAEILNSEDAEDMRVGFTIARYNLRGVHKRDPEGLSERSLAAGYRDKADQLDSQRYYRLADSIRRLAELYEQEAERLASEDEFDDR